METTVVPITETDLAFSQLATIFDETIVFPQFRAEYQSPSSMITGVCPIHGFFKKKFSDMIRKKTGCQKCSSLLRVMSKAHGRKRARQNLIDMYRFVSTQIKPDDIVMYRRLGHEGLRRLFVKFRIYQGASF